MKKHADRGIDEVRAARMEVSERYGHDIDRMLADHIKQQEHYANRLVTLTPGQGRRKSSGRATKKRAALAA
ncbi:MAG: hypothetical protein ABSC18_07745 [Verrucomicrobiota bacterium]|jgi:hypothetical protein